METNLEILKQVGHTGKLLAQLRDYCAVGDPVSPKWGEHRCVYNESDVRHHIAIGVRSAG
jgi:hypothetical protein